MVKMHQKIMVKYSFIERLVIRELFNDIIIIIYYPTVFLTTAASITKQFNKT